jgi:ATP-dependent DNA helicase PIF1
MKLAFSSTCSKCGKNFPISEEKDDSEDELCVKCKFRKNCESEPESLRRLRSELDSKRNIVCIGPGGSGKSVLLRKLAEQMSLSDPPILFDIICPTGASALNVGGVTLHSLFGWTPGRNSAKGVGLFFGLSCAKIAKRMISDENIREKLDHCLPRYKAGIKKLKSVQCFLGDEFSMWPYELLCAMDRICRVIKGQINLPFGGIQLVLFGDPFQLPPTRGGFVFNGKVWDELNFSLHQISGNQLYRFSTAELSDMTRMIRLGIVSRNVETKFMERTKKPPSRVMELFFTNADADKYNKQCYGELASSEVIYNSTFMAYLNVVGSNVSSLSLSCPKQMKFGAEEMSAWKNAVNLKQVVKHVNEEFRHFQKNLTSVYGEDFMNMKFKPGSRVICTVNHREGGTLLYSNGSAGTIQECAKDHVLLALDDGRTIIVKPKILEVLRRVRIWTEDEKDGKEMLLDSRFTFSHIPFRLGYAITFNRAQGMTMDRVNVNGKGLIRKIGMLYVGLSRCRNLNELYLDGVSLGKVKASAATLVKFQEHFIEEIKHLYKAHPEWFDEFVLQIDQAPLVQKILELIHCIKSGASIPKLVDLSLEDGDDGKSENKTEFETMIVMPVFDPTAGSHLVKNRGNSQRELRKWLLKNQSKCPITGENIAEVLDVAHIKPYCEFTGDELKTAHVDNGSLMRKDLHALYDRGYFAFADDGTIIQSKTFASSPNYAQFKKCNLPIFVSRPHLAWHRQNVFNSEL